LNIVSMNLLDAIGSSPHTICIVGTVKLTFSPGVMTKTWLIPNGSAPSTGS